MVVQHNIAAMNANRMLGAITAVQAKSTEKLSSGYKINRAADDAAGLSISEKMRRQVRGLTQAAANAMDGISCVQTAEGALNEIHDMLHRMSELAIKGANDTLTVDDRTYIRDEVRQLMNEIDRVHSATTFNEQSLLDGTFTGKELQAGAEADQRISISICDIGSNALLGSAMAKALLYEVENSNKLCITNDINYGQHQPGERVFWYPIEGNSAKLSAVGDVPPITEYSHTHLLGMRDLSVFHDFDYDALLDEQVKDKISSGHYEALSDYPPEERNFQALNAFVKSAIEDISTMRSELGAIQNRLEHTINNLNNVIENTTQAESRIRDADMASEMVQYSNRNILMQAGQMMLAQANQNNQGVLALLS